MDRLKSKLLPRKFHAPSVPTPLPPDAEAYLQRLVDLSGAPQTSFYVELDGQAQEATLVRGQSGLLPADGSKSNQPPRRPAEHKNPPRDNPPPPMPKDTHAIVYSVGSITKIFINVAYYRLLSSGRFNELGLSWEKSACDLFNERRDYHERTRIQRISRDPTIRELLLHRNGFAPMNRELFAPDGAFIISEVDFLKLAPQVTEAHFKGQRQGFSVYSNANHIFAGLLLEEIMEIPLNEALQQLVFGPLQMSHTVMDKASLLRLQSEGAFIAQGHRVSAQMEVSGLLSDHNYLRDAVEVASLGAYSSTEDVAKLVREFLKAFDHASNLFSEEDASEFFGPSCDYHDGGKMSLAGLFCDADSSLPGSESLQAILSPKPHTFNFRIGKMANGSPCKLYYKAGSIDGYTATLYISLRHRMFVIVFANCSGPVDVTEHIARYILQETIDLVPRIDVHQDALTASTRCSQKLSSLEQEQKEDQSWQDSIDQFVGTYKHVQFAKELEITSLGDLILRGEGKTSSKMRARRSGNMLRIFPGDAGFGIDSWSVWSDRDFVFQDRNEGIYLVDRSNGDQFRKSTSTPDR